MRDAIGAALQHADFDAEPNKKLPGVHKLNICNRTRSGEGVQLELSRSFRRKLRQEQPLLGRFCKAIRDGIQSS